MQEATITELNFKRVRVNWIKKRKRIEKGGGVEDKVEGRTGGRQ